MRLSAIAIAAAWLAACGQAPPNPYPDAAQQRFYANCPADNPVCTCTWDKITRAVTYEEYEAALERFRQTGNMEPAITRARTACVEQNRD